MYVLVLPVSGGGFVSQLAIIQHLCEIKFVPNLILASSGGNVAAYIAAAANWEWAAIERISRELRQEFFYKPWCDVSIMSNIIGYFKGNIYNQGVGIHDFFKKHFTEESIVKYEIWTGTYNKNRQKSRLFCNKRKEDSILDVSCIDYELTQSMTPLFTNGDIKLIGDAGIASASIPSVVPSQKINDEEYIDGGVSSSSPLSIMQEPIFKHVKNNNDSLHIIYANSVDLSVPHVNEIHNIIDTWRQTADFLIKFQTVIDRLSAYELLRFNSEDIKKDEFNCNYENMLLIKEIYTKIKYTVLEIYPSPRKEINLSRFTGNDIVDAIRDCYGNCRCRLWWIPDKNNDYNQEINNIILKCKKN